MVPTEKFTYFVYNDGYDPQFLRLGTMVLDYANPRTKKPYLHPDVKELLQEPPLATADERPICSISQRKDGSYAFGVGLEGLLDFDHSGSNAVYRRVVGKGSKVELINPSGFFEENVLRENAARLWLETRLSVANKLSRWVKNVVSSPKIWLLTGIYLIEDATVYTISSKASLNAISLTVPIPEPTGLAALLGVAAGARFSLGDQFVGEAAAQISGRKVYAAQWQQVDAKYVYAKRANWDAEALGKQLQLFDVVNLGTERGDTDEVRLVEVGLTENRVILDDGAIGELGSGENEYEYDEEMWARFEEEVDDLLDEL